MKWDWPERTQGVRCGGSRGLIRPLLAYFPAGRRHVCFLGNRECWSAVAAFRTRASPVLALTLCSNQARATCLASRVHISCLLQVVAVPQMWVLTWQRPLPQEECCAQVVVRGWAGPVTERRPWEDFWGGDGSGAQLATP